MRYLKIYSLVFIIASCNNQNNEVLPIEEVKPDHVLSIINTTSEQISFANINSSLVCFEQERQFWLRQGFSQGIAPFDTVTKVNSSEFIHENIDNLIGCIRETKFTVGPSDGFKFPTWVVIDTINSNERYELTFVWPNDTLIYNRVE